MTRMTRSDTIESAYSEIPGLGPIRIPGPISVVFYTRGAHFCILPISNIMFDFYHTNSAQRTT